jgi:alpha-galactosidase
VIAFLRKIKNNILSLLNPEKVRGKAAPEPVFKQLLVRYRSEKGQEKIKIPGRAGPDISVSLDNTKQLKHGNLLKIVLNPAPSAEKLELEEFKIMLNPAFPAGTKTLTNGFQSWSRSEELGPGESMPRLVPLFNLLLAPFGDRRIYRRPGGKERFHSWTYSWFRFPDDTIFFIGSVTERNGYTVIDYDYAKDRLIVAKDCRGAGLSSDLEIMNLYYGFGRLDSLINEYTGLTSAGQETASKKSGWCSWYNYYTAIDEETICSNIAELSASRLPLDYFQIDDGWQQAIGDWLAPNEKFTSGMDSISEKIRSSGLKPGLWLAPFIAVPSSQLFKEHPEWILRDVKGKPLKAGFNPGWEGYFYALDLDHPGVRNYLASVFDQVINHWGYNFLKLDFLYAAVLAPRAGKTRGALMCEAIDLLKKLTEGAETLGCGVPLGPAFGHFDFCRIGADVAPYWQDYLRLIKYPERVSTENSLVSTIGRRQLDRRMFRNDPDVFMLRDGLKGVNQNHLTANQRFTLFFINNLLGGLLFFSDRYSELTSEQQALLREAYPLHEAEIYGYDSYRGLHQFEFTATGNYYTAYANLSGEPRKVRLPGGRWFSKATFPDLECSSLELEPYQSICLRQIEGDQGVYLLGASGHLFPGAQVLQLEADSSEIRLTLENNASPETVVYIAAPGDSNSYRINGIEYELQHGASLNYLAVPAGEVS